jgi:hypothetical protein
MKPSLWKRLIPRLAGLIIAAWALYEIICQHHLLGL